jgi:SAM-dependent methyltransferase
MKINFFKGLYDAMMSEMRKNEISLIEPNSTQSDIILLDLGCSSGEFTIQVAEKLNTKKIYGIEINNEKGKKAKDKGIVVYNSDLNKPFPIKDESIDVIVASNVIEHLVDTDNFIMEIYRTLKPNGYAIISTDNLASWHNIFSLILGFQPNTAQISNKALVGNFLAAFDNIPGKASELYGQAHLRIFVYPSLKGIFEFYGFKVEKVLAAGYYPFPKGIAKILARIDKRHSAQLTIKVRKG